MQEPTLHLWRRRQDGQKSLSDSLVWYSSRDDDIVTRSFEAAREEVSGPC